MQRGRIQRFNVLLYITTLLSPLSPLIYYHMIFHIINIISYQCNMKLSNFENKDFEYESQLSKQYLLLALFDITIKETR